MIVKLFENKGAPYMTQEEFHQKSLEWIKASKNSWNHITLMAYFCAKYREKNGVNFRFAAWKGEPARTKESRDFSKLVKLFISDSKLIADKKSAKISAIAKAYNYINWMFDWKFRSGDKSVTGTRIFLNHNLLNEFERMYSSHLMKKKKSDDFNSIKSWIKDNAPSFIENYDFEDFGDLSIILSFIKQNNFEDKSDEMVAYKYCKKIGVL